MKRYRDYSGYLRERFGERVQKIAIDAAMNCPNRDGTISSSGCIFCDHRGAGTGQMLDKGMTPTEQIIRAKQFLSRRYGAGKFIAYLQSFTNTYGPIDRLERLYNEVLSSPDMVGLAVGTRPDCVDDSILDLLSTYKKKYMVWLEYGLQSAHDVTLARINRGHDAACFEKYAKAAACRGLEVCAHVILGLPGETPEMMLETARFLSRCAIHGVKIHLLYVTKGTALEKLYINGGLRCLEQREYVDLVVRFLELLPECFVIQRLTGDPSAAELAAPQWAVEKNTTLSLIRRELEARDTWQGKLCPVTQSPQGNDPGREHPEHCTDQPSNRRAGSF
jgi:uncharacterized protein